MLLEFSRETLVVWQNAEYVVGQGVGLTPVEALVVAKHLLLLAVIHVMIGDLPVSSHLLLLQQTLRVLLVFFREMFVVRLDADNVEELAVGRSLVGVIIAVVHRSPQLETLVTTGEHLVWLTFLHRLLHRLQELTPCVFLDLFLETLVVLQRVVHAEDLVVEQPPGEEPIVAEDLLLPVVFLATTM